MRVFSVYILFLISRVRTARLFRPRHTNLSKIHLFRQVLGVKMVYKMFFMKKMIKKSRKKFGGNEKVRIFAVRLRNNDAEKFQKHVQTAKFIDNIERE